MKNVFVSVALAIPLVASAQNLLTNGSFEAGFASWALSGPASVNPATVVSTVGPTLPFGNSVTPDNAVGNPSPDAAGTRGVYFVDDITPQVVAQTLAFVSPGTYSVGFDYYVPALGLANVAPSTLFVQFGSTFATIPLLSSNPAVRANVWTHFGTTVTIPGPGSVTFSFGFSPTGSASVFGTDVVVDRAYVLAGAIPEPSTYALFAAGLLAMGLMVRRRSNNG